MKILKIGGPLVISAILITVVGLLLRSHFRYEGIVTDLSSWSSFFTVFGVIFAIVAGFLLVTVLNRYSNLNQTIEDELNAVESARDFLVYLEDPQQTEIDKIKRALAIYVTSVATTEWTEMSAPGIPMNADTSEELYEVMRSVDRTGGLSHHSCDHTDSAPGSPHSGDQAQTQSHRRIHGLRCNPIDVDANGLPSKRRSSRNCQRKLPSVE